MTTVTLRKANDFERTLIETAKKFTFARTVAISIHRDETVGDIVAGAQNTLKTNLTTAVLLVRAAHAIRAAISQANAESGINALLGEKAALDAEEKVISLVVNGLDGGGIRGRQRGTPDYELDGAAEIAVATKQLENLRARAATADHYNNQETVTVRVLDGEALDALNGDLAAIQLRKKDISDSLLGLNMNTKITLSSDTVALLKQFKLIA